MFGCLFVGNGLKFWKANEDEPKEPKSSWWWYRPQSADTETTAYALMAMLNMIDSTSDKVSRGLPVVRWLSTQRNPYGGFGSTQVSSIAIDSDMNTDSLSNGNVFTSVSGYSDRSSSSIRICPANLH